MKNNKIVRFLTAQTISLFGSSIVQFAIIWHITLTTSSGLMMTFATLCGFLPQILVSLFGGVWVDRYNRKNLIMISDSVIAFATLVLAILFLTGHENILYLYVALIIRSVGTGVQMPAVNAIIPQIVEPAMLMKVNGINSTLISLTMFLSPFASGALLSIMPIESAFFVDVVTAVIGVGITYFISVPPHQKSEKIESQIEGIKEGFVYLRHNKFIKNLLLFQIIVLFLVSPSAFLTPLLVSRTFGAEVWRLGLSEMMFSAGAVIGGILIASWGGFKNKMLTTILAGAAYGVLMAALGFAHLFLVYLLFNLFIGITMPCYNTPITTQIQERVEPFMQGRVFSFIQISTSAALPLGMVLFGPLADFVSVQAILIVCGCAVLIYTVKQGVRYCS